MPNLGTKAKRVASITNRPTCGGNTKSGLTPSVGIGFTGGSKSASMSRANNQIIWPINCQKAIKAGMPVSVNSTCSGGVGHTKKRTACRCSNCFAKKSDTKSTIVNMDTNKDGVIDLDEFKNAAAKSLGGIFRNINQYSEKEFNGFDVNGDGKLDASEQKAMYDIRNQPIPTSVIVSMQAMIEDMHTQLKTLQMNSAATMSAVTGNNSAAAREELVFKIVMEGDYNSFQANTTAQNQLLADVAREMGVPQANVYIAALTSGSVVAEVSVIADNDTGTLTNEEELRERVNLLRQAGILLGGLPVLIIGEPQKIAKIIQSSTDSSSSTTQQAGLPQLQLELAQLTSAFQANNTSVTADIAQLQTNSQESIVQHQLIRNDHETLKNEHILTKTRQDQLLDGPEFD